MQVAVARQVYVAKNKAEAEAALKRAAAHTQRTVDVSRTPGGGRGSHVLNYADGAGGTETNALYDTADNICRKLETLRSVGVSYVLTTMLGGADQLRRVARDVLPALVRHPSRSSVVEPAHS
jgi:alkanesulfonate monooxygenase SsuD/methylene tetrahydromethanopterin reductase-like flavin-dependent oxidoreductase (luciferase family)